MKRLWNGWTRGVMKEIVVDSTTIYLSLRWRERERERVRSP